MTRYIAFLRGIGPGNPNMHNDKLRGVFEELGFTNVRSVITSGNIVFDSESLDMKTMEAQLEAAWQDKLGFTSTTLIRSQEQLERILDKDPFKGMAHSTKSYLLVTFFKNPPTIDFDFPYQPAGKTYTFIAAPYGVLCSTTDNTVIKTTDLMTWMEKKWGKEMSSRTWLTLHRILKRMTDT